MSESGKTYTDRLGRTFPTKEERSNTGDCYDPETFAEKHGLSLKSAKVILYANGPSKHMCDAAARAFLEAVAARARK